MSCVAEKKLFQLKEQCSTVESEVVLCGHSLEDSHKQLAEVDLGMYE